MPGARGIIGGDYTPEKPSSGAAGQIRKRSGTPANLPSWSSNRDNPIALPGCIASLRAPRPPYSSHPSRRFGPGCRVPDALFIAVPVGTEVLRVGGLRVIALVA